MHRQNFKSCLKEAVAGIATYDISLPSVSHITQPLHPISHRGEIANALRCLLLASFMQASLIVSMCSILYFGFSYMCNAPLYPFQ